ARLRRFVLAHEIAHMLLARDLSALGAKALYGRSESLCSYRFVEHLCDFAAREILLPENALRKELRLCQFTLELLANTSNEAECDWELVAEAISDLPGQWRQLTFLFCRSDHNSASARVIPVRTTLIELMRSEEDLVTRALRERKIVSGSQDLWIGANKTTLSADALALDPNTIVVLLNHDGGHN